MFRGLWWLLGAAAAASLVWLAITFGLIGSAMDAQERQAVLQTVGDRLGLILLTWGGGMAVIGWGLKRWFDLWVTPSVQLAEEAQVLAWLKQQGTAGKPALAAHAQSLT